MYRRVGMIAAILAFSLWPSLINLHLTPVQQDNALKPLPGGVHPRLASAYGNQPLYFEPNAGQADPRVAYLARGQGYAVFLTSGEVVLALQRRITRTDAEPTAPAFGASSAASPQTVGTALRMHLVGSNPNASLAGLDELTGRSNYFLGNDPKKWRTDIPHYARTKLESVYPGIDLVFYGNGRQLEHDFVVAPKADPRAIRLAFHGTETPHLRENGDLGLPLPGGEVTLHAPKAYQLIGGARQPVSAGFLVADNGEVGFQIGDYDASRPLVIDPVLRYSTYLGGGLGVDKSDQGNGIAVDTAGDAYVVGNADSSDFPTTDGAFDRSGGYAAFVAKFDQNGALVYSTFLGGGGYDTEANAVTVDSGGHAYVTGYTGRTDFPTTPGAFQTSCAPGGSPYGCNDAFVVKLNPQGSGLVYSTYLGGPSDPTTPGVYGDDNGNAIAVDSEGNAYVTGLTRSNKFPVTANAFQTTYAGGWADVFVAKLNASGSALVYATYLGGTGGSLHGDEPYAIAVDGQGQAYVTGMTTSADFPTTVGAFKPTWSGYTNGFISKLSADGSALVYSTYLAGPGAGRVYGGRGIAVDAAGNAYVTGGPAEDGFPTTPGSFKPTCPGLCSDAFVLKLNPAGSGLVWSTYLGGTGGEQGNAIALDTQGNVYVTGNTTSADFPILDPVQETWAGTGGNYWGDVFVTKLSPDGSHLIYSTFFGGSNDDIGLGIAVDQLGNAYVTGGTASTDFPTLNPVQSSNHGAIDAFVFKLAQQHELAVTKTGTGNGTVVSNPAGIDCGTSCNALFDAGTSVTLTATPAANSIFMGWGGEAECAGTGPCVVRVTQAGTVTATFNVGTPSATTLLSPSGPISTPTPTYNWSAVATAAQYYLWVQDSTGLKVSQWYTAAQANCGSGTGSCSATPGIALAPGAASWRVRTWNSYGYGPYSATWTVSPTPPPATTLLAPSGTITTTTPTYSWQAVPTAAEYYLAVQDGTGLKEDRWLTATQANCGSGTGTCSVAASQALAPGMASWRMRTWNAVGYGPYSGPWTFTVSLVPPAAILLSPSGIIATTTPAYTWQAVPAAEYYYLWVQDSSGLKVSQWYTAAQAGCGSGTGTCSVTPSTALAAGLATWRVRTWNSYGYGPYSATWTCTVDLTPPAVTLISPSGSITTAVPTYSWSAVPTAEYYYLWVQDSTGLKVSQWYTAAQANCGSGSGTCSVTPSTALTTGTASWRVRTWNSYGYGPYSATGIFTVSGAGGPPPATTLLSPSGTVSTTTPTYAWQAVGTAEQYYLQVTQGGMDKVSQWYTAAQANCGSGSGTCSVTPSTALTTGTASWRVRTWNSMGYGPYAGPQSFTVSSP